MRHRGRRMLMLLTPWGHNRNSNIAGSEPVIRQHFSLACQSFSVNRLGFRVDFVVCWLGYCCNGKYLPSPAGGRGRGGRRPDEGVCQDGLPLRTPSPPTPLPQVVKSGFRAVRCLPTERCSLTSEHSLPTGTQGRGECPAVAPDFNLRKNLRNATKNSGIIKTTS